MDSSGIPVVVMGLGEIGQAIARDVIARPDLRLVGAVDPALAGRSLPEVLGGPAPSLEIAAEPRAAFAAARGGVLLQATVNPRLPPLFRRRKTASCGPPKRGPECASRDF